MSELIPTLLMLIFWIFIVSAVGRFFKKIFGTNQQNQKSKTTSAQPDKKPQTFQDIFKELKKQIEDAQQKQNIPPYAKKEEAKPETYPDLKTIQQEAKKQQELKRLQQMQRRQNPVQQKKYQQHDLVTEAEKKRSLEYQRVVEEERRREHDAEQRRLEEKIFAPVKEDEEAVAFDLDLRNAIIGSIILERKYE